MSFRTVWSNYKWNFYVNETKPSCLQTQEHKWKIKVYLNLFLLLSDYPTSNKLVSIFIFPQYLLRFLTALYVFYSKKFVLLFNSSNIVRKETSRKVYKCITYRKVLNFNNTILVALKNNLVVLKHSFLSQLLDLWVYIRKFSFKKCLKTQSEIFINENKMFASVGISWVNKYSFMFRGLRLWWSWSH